MAFGVKRDELNNWKRKVNRGEIAFLTHFWFDPRFPNSRSVTKVGCINLRRLAEWGKDYQLNPEWIDDRSAFPHFDLMGDRQYTILKKEGLFDVILKFKLQPLEN